MLAKCASSCVARHIQGVGVLETGGFEALSNLAGKVWYGTSQAPSPRFASEILQKCLWKDLFSAPTEWWDVRRSKATPRHPDFKHKKFKVALWLNSHHKPPWVDSQLATWDAGTKRPPDSASTTSAQGQEALKGTHERQYVEAANCSRLCDDGRITDAMAALDLLVHRGCHVHNNLFYRLLKRCIASKDLVLGKRIHALTVRSGYEGDPFLATHLISLYASHGRLEEAMRVFTKVSTPDAYVWASIIFACARHGEAAKAVRLYQQMRESTVHPDNRIYSAVLKACATAGDLVAGKEVHAHILASPGKPDIFVQNGLLDMYAKCRSLTDARSVFDRLPEKNVVTWNAMLAGYAQQGMGQEALSLYDGMKQEGHSLPDTVTFVCLLQACASIGVGALSEGKQLHAQIEEQELQDDVVLGCSLVNMYAKCGSLEDARRVFDRLPEKNVLTWTSMITGYSRQGMGQEALSLHNGMQQEGLAPPDSVTWMSLLQACASVGVRALHKGKQLHAQIKEQGLQDDVALGGNLVQMYAKCGSLEDARSVFDKLPDKTMVAWKAMIAGCAQQGMGQQALSLYSSMQQEGVSPPDSVTFGCLLQACASLGAGALHHGKQLHEHIRGEGLHTDVVLGGRLVNMYAKCGSLEDARIVFDNLPGRNVVTWNAMLAGYAKQGMGQEALSLHNSMQQEGLYLPDSVTFICLLQACASVGVGALNEGRQLHAQIQDQGLQDDVVLGCSLVNMYAKCGSVEDARSLFDKLPQKDVVTWTTMIAGYSRQGMGQEALSLYVAMQEENLSPPDSVTFISLLQACASVGVGALNEGKQLHAEIQEQGLQDDVALGGSLVNMYAKCSSIEDARWVFDRLPDKNVVTWTSMIAGYAQQEMGQQALTLYKSMHEEGLSPPNSVTFACLLQSCASVGVVALDEGKQLHAQIEERGLQGDVVLGGSLVNMYAKCGSLEAARKVFDTLSQRDVVTWNAMLAGYAHQSIGQEAMRLYSSMQQEGLSPNSVTFVCLLQACASVGAGALYDGKQLHAQIEERGLQGDVVLGGSLINMYAKCGSLEDAHKVFNRLPDKNVVTWNSMIAGYAQQGMAQEALSLYSSMQQEALSPDSITFLCLLQACVVVAALPVGKQLHAEIEERGMQHDVVVGAALVNMYAKCGSMFDSQQVFDALPERSSEAWGALIGGYARQGDSDVVFDLLDSMALKGIQPDGITFLNVLTVCSHAGLVDKGRKYFEDMRTDYGLSPTVEHYTCMMDLLGRAGHLDEALEVAKTMPVLADGAVWSTLLGACRKWKNVEIGQQAFEFAVSLDGKDAASYVAMSNIYASAQMWEKAKEMQVRRAKCGAQKKPGQSWWTDMSGVVHTFVVGDKQHPESEGIYARLQQLVPKMKKEGYVPHIASSLRDIPDDEKEAELCGHSEKLAIAYALNRTAEGQTIRVVKNLRVCEDCHTATAYISKVEQRTIICRDASRFHVYEDGKCSCGDYW